MSYYVGFSFKAAFLNLNLNSYKDTVSIICPINPIGFLMQKDIMFLKGLSTAYIFLGKFIPQKTKGMLRSSMVFYWHAEKNVVMKFALKCIS